MTRDLVAGEYDLNCGQFEIDFRTINAKGIQDAQLTETDFLSMSDLRE